MLTDSNVLDFAARVARAAHYGQTDKAGDPYEDHLSRVVELVPGVVPKTVAWLHDVVEDSEFGNDSEIRLTLLGFSPAVVRSVLILTRGYFQPCTSYAAYIDSIIESNDQVAIAVKMADLTDHLRPNCPTSLRPRYEAALAQLRSSGQLGCLMVKVVSEKRFRLEDGTNGPEYEAILECIAFWERKRQEAEDRLLEFRERLALAEGHP